MEVITVSIVKGGCGKTATATALAQAAAKDGKRVLLIDIDPQGNAGLTMGADMSLSNSWQLFHDQPITELIQETEQGVDIIPGNLKLSQEKTTANSAKRLREALQPVAGYYDYCIIDTPPAANELLFNAIIAADRVIIPVEADRSSAQGLFQCVDIVDQLKEYKPTQPKVGVVITRYDNRANVNRSMKALITQAAEQKGLPVWGTIRQGVAVREAAALQQSLFEIAPTSKVAADYAALYNTIKEN